jgi:DNA invertase Pin-like site-specific DNA recombinase
VSWFSAELGPKRLGLSTASTILARDLIRCRAHETIALIHVPGARGVFGETLSDEFVDVMLTKLASALRPGPHAEDEREPNCGITGHGTTRHRRPGHPRSQEQNRWSLRDRDKRKAGAIIYGANTWFQVVAGRLVGKRNDRPELEKALAACKKQKAKLVIAKLDRLSARTSAALKAAKARGNRLGNPRLSEARRHATVAKKENADRYSANVLPVIREIQKSCIKSLRGVARALAARGIPTARGGAWSPVQVSAILQRAK